MTDIANWFIQLGFDVLSAAVIAILTIIITRVSQRHDNWVEIRSAILSRLDSLRASIVQLADNPSKYNNIHFIAYFTTDINFICHLESRIRNRKAKENLRKIEKMLFQGYSDILIDPANEEILNLHGRNSQYSDDYNAFFTRVDSLINNVTKTLLSVN